MQCERLQDRHAMKLSDTGFCASNLQGKCLSWLPFESVDKLSCSSRALGLLTMEDLSLTFNLVEMHNGRATMMERAV